MTRVSLIGELYDCVKPLFDQTIRPEGVELVVTRSPSPEAMRRQLTAWEFDICEMAFGAYLIARAQGADVTAIPVFPRRAFFHTNFACHADARIEDLRATIAASCKTAGHPVRKRSACEDARILCWRSLYLWRRRESNDAGNRGSVVSGARARPRQATARATFHARY